MSLCHVSLPQSQELPSHLIVFNNQESTGPGPFILTILFHYSSYSFHHQPNRGWLLQPCMELTNRERMRAHIRWIVTLRGCLSKCSGPICWQELRATPLSTCKSAHTNTEGMVSLPLHLVYSTFCSLYGEDSQQCTGCVYFKRTTVIQIIRKQPETWSVTLMRQQC